MLSPNAQEFLVGGKEGGRAKSKQQQLSSSKTRVPKDNHRGSGKGASSSRGARARNGGAEDRGSANASGPRLTPAEEEAADLAEALALVAAVEQADAASARPAGKRRGGKQRARGERADHLLRSMFVSEPPPPPPPEHRPRPPPSSSSSSRHHGGGGGGSAAALQARVRLAIDPGAGSIPGADAAAPWEAVRAVHVCFEAEAEARCPVSLEPLSAGGGGAACAFCLPCGHAFEPASAARVLLSSPASAPCPVCLATFTRDDLRPASVEVVGPPPSAATTAAPGDGAWTFKALAKELGSAAPPGSSPHNPLPTVAGPGGGRSPNLGPPPPPSPA